MTQKRRTRGWLQDEAKLRRPFTVSGHVVAQTFFLLGFALSNIEPNYNTPASSTSLVVFLLSVLSALLVGAVDEFAGLPERPEWSIPSRIETSLVVAALGALVVDLGMSIAPSSNKEFSPHNP